MSDENTGRRSRSRRARPLPKGPGKEGPKGFATDNTAETVHRSLIRVREMAADLSVEHREFEAMLRRIEATVANSGGSVRRSSLGSVFGRTTAERLVLRDIWLYAALALGIGAAITFVLAGGAVPVLGLLAFGAVAGAAILHLDALGRFARARDGRTPSDLTRIFG